MKKTLNIFMYILMLGMVVLSTAYAGDVDTDQFNSRANLEKTVDENVVIQRGIGTEINLTISNFTYDYYIEYTLYDDLVFFVDTNGFFDNISIAYTFGSVNNTLYSQTISKSIFNNGIYVTFSPTTNNENLLLFVDLPGDTGYANIESHLKSKPHINDIMVDLVAPIIDLMELNITIWKVIFTGLMFIIALGFFIGLMGGGFWIYRKSKRMREGEGL